MARPKSSDKREAILNAAAFVIVRQGLGAPTALIAKEAGISNGSLFTYFETKAELYNQLYLELKRDMVGTALESFPESTDLRVQAEHAWYHWLAWATSHPEKRRALAQLNVCDLITPETRVAGAKIMAPMAVLMDRLQQRGPLKNAPVGFVRAMINSLLEATMDYAISDSANARQHCQTGFEIFWRALA